MLLPMLLPMVFLWYMVFPWILWYVYYCHFLWYWQYWVFDGYLKSGFRRQGAAARSFRLAFQEDAAVATLAGDGWRCHGTISLGLSPKISKMSQVVAIRYTLQGSCGNSIYVCLVYELQRALWFNISALYSVQFTSLPVQRVCVCVSVCVSVWVCECVSKWASEQVSKWASEQVSRWVREYVSKSVSEWVSE